MRQKFSTLFALIVGFLILLLSIGFALLQSSGDPILAHSETDFPLMGAHRLVECKQCHTDYAFKGIPSGCVLCHQEDEAHDGQMGTDCASCHTPESWRLATFDHDQTSFPLTGVHASTDCVECHVANVYKGTLQTCIACHWEDDAHDGRFGTDCTVCHSPGWGQATFDHSQTAFPLTGAHAEANCAQCHVDYVYEGTPQECIVCHQGDDAHNGQFGEDCAACHTPGWRQATFDHTQTAFPLVGAHRLVSCSQCHVDNVYAGTSQDCAACHLENDAHDGQLGTDCSICHTPGWKQAGFDHTQTAFPLTGAHADATCIQCHADGVYAGTSQVCASCHQEEDAHDGKFGADCGACHSPGWKQATVDHSLVAFPLVGAHTVVDCAQCHVDDVFAGTPQDCVACHAADDAHDGERGTDCALCHSPEGWK